MTTTQIRGKRSKKSVCEKSMNIMVNFIRLSSLSLAKHSLGSYGGGAPSNSTITPSISTTEVELPGNEAVKKLLVEPNYKEITKGSSYLMEPHEVDDDINWRAGQFIDGIRKRNMVESKKIRSGVSRDFVLLPPPPRRPNR